jgi:hypothetical protein
MNDDGRWIAAGLVGALGVAAALKRQTARAPESRTWFHATPATNAGAITASGQLKPGRAFGTDALLTRDPVRWLQPFVRKANDGTRLDDAPSPALPGFVYLTTSDAVLTHHVPEHRAVFETAPRQNELWPDEDFIGPVVVAVAHNDVSYLKSVFLRYLEAPVPDVMVWGRKIVAAAPPELSHGARQIPMEVYGRCPLQIAVGLSVLSAGLQDRSLARLLKSGIPLTNIVAHRGAVRVVRQTPA